MVVDEGKQTAFYQTAQARYEGDVLPNMFSASGGEYHARIRRVTGHVYSMTAITELEPHVDSCVRLFLSKPKETSASGTPFDIDAWLQYYSFDCLGALSFSQDIGFLSSGCDVGSMIHAVDTIFDYVALVSAQVRRRHNVIHADLHLFRLAKSQFLINSYLEIPYWESSSPKSRSPVEY